MLNCLQLIQRVCKRIGISVPNAAYTSSDLQVQQLVELANEEGQEQASRYQWQALQREATFTTVAAELQTSLAAITTGAGWIVNQTIWNRTLRRPVYGPDSLQDWQQQKAIQIAGPFNRYRIIANNIRFYPVPAAGQDCYFEYITNQWTAAGGTEYQSDTDTSLLDDTTMILGTIWRWKQAKGMTYAEDFAKYERRIAELLQRDAVKPTLSMTGTMYDVVPLVVVPSGSWNQP
jgi:hypothetical protein